MSLISDPTTNTTIIILVVAIAVTASMAVLFGMKLRGKKPKKEEKSTNKSLKDTDLEIPNISFRMSKSIQTTTASNAKDELRILDLEREILGDSIRRLYEAQAEGKITETERERLAITYKNRMSTIKESIAKDENIVALHELEGMQEDLMQLFSERFSELTGKVEELRGKIDIKPIREIPIKMPTPIAPIQQMEQDDDEEETTPTYRNRSSNDNSGEEKQKKKRKPATSTEKSDAKSEAEKRIETIRSEVEKVLDKLGQMEIEN
ncbi:MAG: hypothetical protein LBB87_01355 [Nitrososphaerota archaeon]|jgi:hypothetical protein|nr:hypothetical protein [Nitrososphaerota archaeon]